MIVLGFDTATSATAVALRRDGHATSEARDDPAAGAHPGHATRLLGMAAGLLADDAVAWEEIERVAVGVGPGAFTGLRVGVATARGLAQSLGCELVGVSSLRALAAAAFAGSPSGAPEAVLAVIDARRGEVFAAAFAPGDGDGPRELLAPRALAPDQLAELPERALEAPAARGAWLAVGDGAVRYAEAVAAAGLPSPPAASPLQRVSATAVCDLAAGAAPEAAAGVLPDYRRRPDAELAAAAAAGGAAR
jgi:tRNA threonylcarbamoyladenosine biosynthesis protein TsaB